MKDSDCTKLKAIFNTPVYQHCLILAKSQLQKLENPFQYSSTLAVVLDSFIKKVSATGTCWSDLIGNQVWQFSKLFPSVPDPNSKMQT